MFVEFVYKLRGIDKWPSTPATVTAVEQVSDGGRSGLTRTITFNYQTSNGDIQSGDLFVDSYTSVYNVSVRDTFDLQYNPAHPERFYCAEAKSVSAEIRLGITIVGGTFAIAVFIIEFLGRMQQ